MPRASTSIATSDPPRTDLEPRREATARALSLWRPTSIRRVEATFAGAQPAKAQNSSAPYATEVKLVTCSAVMSSRGVR